MVSFFIQSLFLFLVVIFQISFLNIVFSHIFLNALLAVAIALTLTRGFFVAWPWVICLGIIFDIFSANVVGVTPIVLIVFSYGISFLSRRFLLENKTSGILIAMLFMAIACLFYFPLVWVVRHIAFGVPLSTEHFSLYVASTNILGVVISNALLFVLLYALTQRINQALDFYGDRVIVKR
jgi:cell shape-determining protein MreD